MDSNIGNYTIEGLIGQGSMGKVYLGRHPVLGQEVAIKVLSEDFSSYPELVKRFRREARAIAAIRHAAIVKAFDFGDLQDGRSYYVMELLKGQSLQAYMKARGPLPLEEATAIILPLSEALGVCHGAGFIHRDIKPENVFLTNAEDGSVFPKIIDFGIAKLKHPDGEGDSVVTRMDAVLGTPLYMAPEQGPGVKADVGPWSDVYSLAATLYHMLAYRPPFYSESPMELIIMHTHRERPKVTEVRKDLPEDLDRVIQKAMAIHPSERFQSMAEFSAAYSGAVEVDESLGAPGALADIERLEGLEGEALEAALGGKTIVDPGPRSGERSLSPSVGPREAKAGDASGGKGEEDFEEGAPEEPSVIVDSGLSHEDVVEVPDKAEEAKGSKGEEGKAAEEEGGPKKAEKETEGEREGGGESSQSDKKASREKSVTDWDAAQEFVMDAHVAPEIEALHEKRRRAYKWVFMALFFVAAAAAVVWYFVVYEGEKKAPAIPVKLASVTSQTQHCCGLLKDSGKVVCWGRNNYGQLGVGDKEARTRPAEVAGLEDAVSVSAGGRHTCAVKKEGTVFCWGKNKTGQLGDGTTTARVKPVQVDGIDSAVRVHAGAEHTCALLSDATVKCWGWNLFGQLGHASEKNLSKTPVLVATTVKVKSLAAGGFHNCLLTDHGKVFCWGKNDVGQLGLGDDKHRRKPHEVKGVAKAREVATGGAHTCTVMESGRAACWGRNASGQLGSESKEKVVKVPARVKLPQGILQITAGGGYLGGFTCALNKKEQVYCWGNNLYGQVGGEPGTNYRNPRRVKGLSKVLAVETGGLHSCAVLEGGITKCWGRNRDGQLGVGGTEDLSKPTVVQR